MARKTPTTPKARKGKPAAAPKLKAERRSAKKPAAETAPGEELELLPPAAPGGTPGEARHDAIYPSKDNPRTAFAAKGWSADKDEALRELAESIAALGLMQPLVVRAGGRNRIDGYELIAGHRRWHAIGLLIADGRWAAGRPVPVIVRDAQADDQLAAAIVENLQRQDVPPLDEAHAFNRLVEEHGWDKRRIAAAIGKTERYVEFRLDLVTRLAAGEINVTQARTIAALPGKMQKDATEIARRGADEHSIRRQLLHDKPRVRDAAFPLERYTGDFIGEEGDEDRRFADAGQFHRLTSECAEEKVAALKEPGRDGKTWSWVQLADNRKSEHAELWKFDKGAKKGEAGAGAFVEIRYSGEIAVHTGLRKQAGRGATGRSAGAGTLAIPKAHWTKAHIARANRIKTEAMQHAVADNAGVALRLAVLGLAGDDEVKIRIERTGGEDAIGQPMARTMRTEAVSKHRKDRNRWRHLVALSDAEVMNILAAQVAATFGTWNGYDPAVGDSELFRAVAETAGVDMRPFVKLDEEYLAGCNKDRLLEIIAATGTGMRANELGSGKGIQNMTAGKLRDVVAQLAAEGALDGFVPRELRIGSAAELAEPLPAKATPLEEAIAFGAALEGAARTGPFPSAEEGPAEAQPEPALDPDTEAELAERVEAAVAELEPATAEPAGEERAAAAAAPAKRTTARKGKSASPARARKGARRLR